jgi:hypothetical protein
MRLRAASLLFVGLVAGAILLLTARALVTVRDAELSDLRCFYEAARLVRTGFDPYDPAIWAGADGGLRRAMVYAVIGVAFVLPWVLTLVSLLGAPLAAHVLVTLATAALTVYALRRLGPLPGPESVPINRSSTTARTSP